MIRNHKLQVAVLFLLLLAVSCSRRQPTGNIPKLPKPPANTKTLASFQGLDRYGFFFALITQSGKPFVQLSDWVNKEPSEVPKEKIRIAQIVPTLVLLHSPDVSVHPEFVGREYIIMRNHEPVCRGKMEMPLLVGHQVPGAHEWNEWDVEPWNEPTPSLEEVSKKIPLAELWKKSYVFSGAPLSCTVASTDLDYNKVFWARFVDMPPPIFLSQDIPQDVRSYIRKEAVERLNATGFADKVRQFREDMGNDEIQPNLEISMWSDTQSIFVEMRASVGEEECGGAMSQWLLWRVTNSQWEEIAHENRARNIVMIADFNQDGKYEIVIREYTDKLMITLYELEGLYLKKVMRMEYPSYEAAC